MKLEDLLGKGYFPKELPPPFHTKDLASNYSILKGTLSSNPIKEPSRCINYSIAKVGLIRKLIKIPNPAHQCELAEAIVNNWASLDALYKTSTISTTRPKLSGERAANPMKYKDFIRKAFLASFPFSYELKTDISQYYPTVYTHSIPWALHGKVIAKTRRFDKTLLGNILDKAVQQTMYGQTIGIPIGPDTSFIIEEIIGCSIDKMMMDEIKDLKGYRYIDDMHFFFHTYAEAENALLKLQHILKEYELQINTQKTKIQKIPKGIEQEWVVQLRAFIIRETEVTQYNDIISFFSLAFDLSNRLNNEYVLSYAIEKIKWVPILSDNNFALLETMLLKTIIAEPSTIKEVFRILYTYSSKVRVGKVEKVILNVIRDSCVRGYDYELSWALWIVKTFKIHVPKDITELLSESKDTISIMIALDLVQTGLITKGDLNTASWQTILEEESLKNENWLLAYEMGIKKWMGTSYAYIDSVPYFKILLNSNISFYNESLQIQPLDVGKKELIEKEPETEYEKTNETVMEKAEEKQKPQKSLHDLLDQMEASEDYIDFGIDFGDY